MTTPIVRADPLLVGDDVYNRWQEARKAWAEQPEVRAALEVLARNPEPKLPRLRGYHWGTDHRTGEKLYVTEPWEACYDAKCGLPHDEGK